MSATTVPTVRAALVTKIKALLVAAGDSTTEVTYGHPGRTIPAKFVAVAQTEDGVGREQRTLPLRKTSSRTETYDLRLILWVQVGDHEPASQQSVTEQAWALAAVIDDGLRDDPDLGGLVTWALPSRFDDEDFLLNEGRAAQIVMSISVQVNRA